MDAQAQSERLVRVRAHAQQVLEGIERIHQILKPAIPLDQLPGWRELRARPLLWSTPDKPWLVATLFGPTGSGKSTVFRLLTGVNVPAGDAVRPVTFNSVAAIPDELDDPTLLQKLFPFSKLAPLQDPSALTDKTLERDTLFYVSYGRPNATSTLNLILADVPDFDTIYKSNWIKAEDMMRRAEIVLFTVYPSAYMDQVVIQNLENCCTHAGQLAILFNKVEDRYQAELIWNDLVHKTKTAPEFASFQKTKRRNGQTLAQFLEQANVYYSPYSRQPRLEDIQPLRPGIDAFNSLLTGAGGLEVLLASLREDSSKAAQSCIQLARDADAEITQIAHNIDLARQQLLQAGALVAGTCFPAGALTQHILDTARQYRPRWIRILSSPATLAVQALSKSKEALRQVLGSKAKPLSDLEKERMQDVIDQLLTALRAHLPESGLTMELCQQLRQDSALQQFPPPPQAWDEDVLETVRTWVKAHPWRTTVLGSANDLLVTIGGAAVGIDLLITGGQTVLWGSVIAGKLGLVGAAGAGGAAAGALLAFYERLGLRDTIERADLAWREKRSQQIADHLAEHLVGPVFLNQWHARKSQLEQLPLEEYRSACAALNEATNA